MNIFFCCRTVSVFQDGTSSYKGIEGYRYKPKSTLFYSSQKNKEEDCYCSIKKGTRDQMDQPSCFLDGVLDIYPCLGLYEYDLCFCVLNRIYTYESFEKNFYQLVFF